MLSWEKVSSHSQNSLHTGTGEQRLKAEREREGERNNIGYVG